jgi:hypothetical protein
MQAMLMDALAFIAFQIDFSHGCMSAAHGWFVGNLVAARP